MEANSIWNYVASGASAIVELGATAATALGAVDAAGRRWLRPGSFKVRLGDTQEPAVIQLDVRGDARELQLVGAAPQ